MNFYRSGEPVIKDNVVTEFVKDDSLSMGYREFCYWFKGIVDMWPGSDIELSNTEVARIRDTLNATIRRGDKPITRGIQQP